MLITRKSQYSQIERTLDIPCTQEQYDAYINGAHIQDAMPNVEMEDREFIMTGMIGEEWNKLFPYEKDYDTDDRDYDDEREYFDDKEDNIAF